MPPNPQEVENRITTTDDAWEENASTQKVYNMTKDEFVEAVKPSLDARAEIKRLELQIQAAIVRRGQADAVSHDLVQKIGGAVRGDVRWGENSAFYAALGYVRKDDRKSGLSRKTDSSTSTTDTTKVAA